MHIYYKAKKAFKTADEFWFLDDIFCSRSVVINIYEMAARFMRLVCAGEK